MNKSELRAEAERVRAALHLKGDEAQRAAALFMKALAPTRAQVIALYAPIWRELDTHPLIELLHEQGVRTALPVILPQENILKFCADDRKIPLVPGPYGIMQPPPDAPALAPDMIVLPLLAFDRKGYRLGYGGGYYDRTLAHLAQTGHKVTSVGYAYAEQICLFPLPREGHDQPLDLVITPQHVHDFRG